MNNGIRKEIFMKNNSIFITSFESKFDDWFRPTDDSFSSVWVLLSSSVSSFRFMLDLTDKHPEVSSDMMESSGDIRFVNCLLGACGFISKNKDYFRYRLAFQIQQFWFQIIKSNLTRILFSFFALSPIDFSSLTISVMAQLGEFTCTSWRNFWSRSSWASWDTGDCLSWVLESEL